MIYVYIEMLFKYMLIFLQNVFKIYKKLSKKYWSKIDKIYIFVHFEIK